MNLKWFILVFGLAFSASGQIQFSYTTNSDGSLTITGYSGPGGNVIIPSTINGAPVTSIGSYAFSYPGFPNYWPTATNLFVPDTVTNLANAAFSRAETYAGNYLMGIYFQGNAPFVASNAFDYFLNVATVVYHLPGTTGFGSNLYQGPIQVWYPGQLQMALSPTNAVIDGAGWNVDGGAWQTNNGMVVNLSNGIHTVSFKPINGWRAPPDEIVNVGTNFITTISASSYYPLPGGPSRPTFQALHTFSGAVLNPPANLDTLGSISPLIVCSNVLYGTTVAGGSFNQGRIFSINLDGTGYNDLCSFTNGGGCHAGLTQSGNVFYGTTENTVFRVNMDGSGFATLCSGLSGAETGVVVQSNTVYGITSNGGTFNAGVILAVNTDGTGFTVLRQFGGFFGDGVLPLAGIVISGSTLYGDTHEGWATNSGIIFSIQTDGTGFTNFPNRSSFAYTPALSKNVLYGMGSGGIFKVNTNGTGFTSFPVPGSEAAGVIVAGDTLYGTTMGGPGNYQTPGYYGSVYAIRTDGTGATNLYDFTDGSDGANPQSTVLLSGTSLFGTTPGGGTNNNGTVYMLSFPPPHLSITPSGTNILFTWPDGVHGAGYDLFSVQNTTNLAAPVAWTALATPPVSVKGWNTVTNSIPVVPTFYRLTQ